MKVCIVGGGNIGTAAAAWCSHRGHHVVICTSNPSVWSNDLQCVDRITGDSFCGTVRTITSNIADAVDGAHVILVTYPSFMLPRFFEELSSVLPYDTYIGVIPGTGGVEFYAKDLLEAGHTLFGMDRVPFIARVKEYGKSVYISPKKSVRMSALPKRSTSDVRKICEDLFGIDIIELPNYLTVTLTPSNPILHTARTYTMFQDYHPGMIYNHSFLFYHEWTDAASAQLLAMDDELQSICRSLLPMDLTKVIPLRTHYESQTISALTQKISSIESLRCITSPMKKISEGAFVPDFSSRYFIEDVPYGLCILKAFAMIANVKTPKMDEVIRMNEKWIGKVYFDEYWNFTTAASELALPQNCGLNSKDSLVEFYLNL